MTGGKKTKKKSGKEEKRRRRRSNKDDEGMLAKWRSDEKVEKKRSRVVQGCVCVPLFLINASHSSSLFFFSFFLQSFCSSTLSERAVCFSVHAVRPAMPCRTQTDTHTHTQTHAHERTHTSHLILLPNLPCANTVRVIRCSQLSDPGVSQTVCTHFHDPLSHTHTLTVHYVCK